MIRPKSVSEVKKYLDAPLCHSNVVLYLVDNKDGSKTQFMLNPFGSGSCNTQELCLSNEFKITRANLSRMLIVSNNDFKEVV